jgi:hypothetical protein
MSLPTGLTDEQIYVFYATHYANIDVRQQDLVRAAEKNNPELVPAIMKDWRTARLNCKRARLKLFLNQSDAVDQLTKDFISADKKMAAALKDLQGLPETIGNIAGVITKAVAAGTALIGHATDKSNV